MNHQITNVASSPDILASVIPVSANTTAKQEVDLSRKEVQAENDADIGGKFSYLEAYKPVLEMHLDSAKPYLKKGYSINDLSKETGIPLHHLTALLNKGYQERFNDFINKLRLEELEKRFNPDWENLTLEGIGKEVGFNSRTTFYNSIKKFKGLSPSAFFDSWQKERQGA